MVLSVAVGAKWKQVIKFLVSASLVSAMVCVLGGMRRVERALVVVTALADLG